MLRGEGHRAGEGEALTLGTPRIFFWMGKKTTPQNPYVLLHTPRLPSRACLLIPLGPSFLNEGRPGLLLGPGHQESVLS